MPKYHVKLRSRASAGDRKTVEDVARRSGASDIRQLFPGTTDRKLGSLYTVDVEPDRESELVARLNELPAVEFVEGEVRRKLKLP